MSQNLIDTMNLPTWNAVAFLSDGTDCTLNDVSSGDVVGRRELWFISGVHYIYDANDGGAPLWGDDAPEPVTLAALCRIAREEIEAGNATREDVHPHVLEAMEAVCLATRELADLESLRPGETGVTTVYCDVEGPHTEHRGAYRGEDVTWK